MMGTRVYAITICFWSLSILAFTSASAFLCSSSLGFLTWDGRTGGVSVAGGVVEVVVVVVAVADSAMMRASRKRTSKKEASRVEGAGTLWDVESSQLRFFVSHHLLPPLNWPFKCNHTSFPIYLTHNHNTLSLSIS